MSNVITPETKLKFFDSIEGLVLRLLEDAKVTWEEVLPHITRWYIENSPTAAEILDKNSTKITNVSQTYKIAKAAIDEWIGVTPGALDTLTEIAQALHNDADIINKLIAQIAQKVDKKDFMRLTVYPNSDFEHEYFDGIMNWDVGAISTFNPGIYSGLCSTSRVRIDSSYEDLPDVSAVNVQIHIASIQKFVVMASAAQTDFDIKHNGWVPRAIYVNGNLQQNATFDIDAVDVVKVAGAVINQDDEVRIEFIAGEAIPETSSEVTMQMSASIGGNEFKRGILIKDGQPLDDSKYFTNKWSSPTYDQMATMDFVTQALVDVTQKLKDGTLPPQS